MTWDLTATETNQPAKVSFEFSPPRTEKAEKTLWHAIERLVPLGPVFVSVTYGAGGSTRERTHETVRKIQDKTGIPAAAHLTCVGASRAEVDDVIHGYYDAGIRHIVALRGDPPTGVGTKFEPHPDGYQSSVELIEGIKRIGDIEVSVSAYPEKHPDASNMDEDVELLRRKVDAGAARAITQFAFDTDKILRYRDLVADAGLNVPIIPGIMPIRNFSGVQRFAKGCGASIPSWLCKLFDGLGDDPVTHAQLAAIVAAEQCLRLQEAGFDQFHFYTINQPDLAYTASYALGRRPQ